MPPIPDSPVLSDDFNQLFAAIWTLLSDLGSCLYDMFLWWPVALIEALWPFLALGLFMVLFDWAPRVFEALGSCIQALSALVCDLFLVAWSYVTTAFLAVCTFFQTCWNEIVAAVLDLGGYVVVHPITGTLILVLAFVLVSRTLTLGTFLFHRVDTEWRAFQRLRELDSHTVNYQSTGHGGNSSCDRPSSPFQSQKVAGQGPRGSQRQ